MQETIAQAQSKFIISKKPDFSSEDVNFSAGETVYVRVENGSSQDASAVLSLLDAGKKTILRLSMTKNGGYKASFKAPNAGGVYYVHIEIKGEGLSFSGEKNINVGGGSSESFVTSQAESKVEEVNKGKMQEEVQKTQTGGSEESQEARVVEQKNLFLRLFEEIISWLRSIFVI